MCYIGQDESKPDIGLPDGGRQSRYAQIASHNPWRWATPILRGRDGKPQISEVMPNAVATDREASETTPDGSLDIRLDVHKDCAMIPVTANAKNTAPPESPTQAELPPTQSRRWAPGARTSRRGVHEAKLAKSLAPEPRSNGDWPSMHNNCRRKGQRPTTESKHERERTMAQRRRAARARSAASTEAMSSKLSRMRSNSGERSASRSDPARHQSTTMRIALGDRRFRNEASVAGVMACIGDAHNDAVVAASTLARRESRRAG